MCYNNSIVRKGLILLVTFQELAENFKTLQKQHEQELKELEKKQGLEKDTLLTKQQQSMQEIKLSSYFHVGDVIALEEVQYLPTEHITTTYTIVAVGEDYIVGYDGNHFTKELLTWVELLEAKKLWHNGERIDL